MANKPLKSIKFPGLSDTYTVPEVDDTLAVTGAAADAKKVGDEISDIKADLSELEDNAGGVRIFEISEEDLVSGKAWTAHGTQMNATGFCLYGEALPIKEKETLISIYNNDFDTGCSQYLWNTLNSSNQIVRYGKTPVIHVQDGEVAIKVAFNMTLNPLSNGRKVWFYSGTSEIPQDKISAALTFGNDVVIDDFTIISGYYCSYLGNWAETTAERSTGMIDIPYGAISMEHNFPLDNDSTRPTVVFFDNSYSVIGTDNTHNKMELPTGAEHCIVQTHNYDSGAEYYVRFTMAEVSAFSLSNDIEALREENSGLYKTDSINLVTSPLALTEIGFYDQVGNKPRYNKNSGWHYQIFDVTPGETYSYNFINPTNHGNFIMFVTKNNIVESYLSGQSLVGTVTIPDGVYYCYISLRTNCNPALFVKENAKIPAYSGATDYIDTYIVDLLNALEEQEITVDLNPSYYYGEHVNIVNSADKAGLKFAIFTDTHYKNDGTQPEYSRIVKELKRLQDDGIIDFVVHLGDAIENQLYNYTDFTDVLANYGVNYMALKGNHDLIKQSVIRTNCTNITGMVFDTLGCWAYLDDDTNNVRYIFLNACDKGSDVDQDKATITMQQGDYSYRQLYWLANTAFNTDKKVILFNHVALKSSSSDGVGVFMSSTNANSYIPAAIVAGFINGTSGSASYIDSGETGAQSSVAWDFTSQGEGNVICLFNGHGHGDYSYTTDYGLLSIMESNALCINNMSATYGYTFPATADTITEVAFDIVNIDPDTEKIKMLRFGRGLNREFN